jgi:hypothetical protein
LKKEIFPFSKLISSFILLVPIGSDAAEVARLLRSPVTGSRTTLLKLADLNPNQRRLVDGVVVIEDDTTTTTTGS